MKSTKLLLLFTAIESSEYGRLRKFLRSPAHNKHEKVIALSEILIESAKKERPLPSREEVFRQIFPDQEYEDLKLRHVMSYLQRVLEDFLIHEEDQKDDLSRRVKLLRAVRRRNLPEYFTFQQNKLDKHLQDESRRDRSFHWQEYNFREEVYQQGVLHSKDVSAQLQQASESLDVYFVISKLRHACNAISHRKILKADYELSFIDEVLKQVEARRLYEIPAVGLYYYTYLVTSTDEVTHFDQLKRSITRFHDLLAPEEMRGIYLLAINYCIQQLNRGHSEFLREAFDLYRVGIENRILFENGFLSPWSYKNIASAGIKLGEFDWTHDFIEKQAEAVLPEYRDQFQAFNRANLQLHKGASREAVETLRKANIQDLFTLLGANVILIKAYYDLDELDLLDYLLNNFEKLLGRKEVLTYHKKNYRNLIRFTRRLLSASIDQGTNRKQLINDINSAEILTDREWLLEKLQN